MAHHIHPLLFDGRGRISTVVGHLNEWMTGTRQGGVTGGLRGHDGNEGGQAVGALLEAEAVSCANDTLAEGA